MTSIGYGDIFPLNDAERVHALIIMILGASLYSNIFSAFISVVQTSGQERLENYYTHMVTKGMCKQLGLPKYIEYKSLMFYSKEKSNDKQNFDLLYELSVNKSFKKLSGSLYSDVLLKIWSSTIP